LPNRARCSVTPSSPPRAGPTAAPRGRREHRGLQLSHTAARRPAATGPSARYPPGYPAEAPRPPTKRAADTLAAASDEARAILEEVGFFQAIRVALIKSVSGEGKKSAAERELAIQQLVSRAVVSTEIVDIMKAAGLEGPDICFLSDEFLAEVRENGQTGPGHRGAEEAGQRHGEGTIPAQRHLRVYPESYDDLTELSDHHPD